MIPVSNPILDTYQTIQVTSVTDSWQQQMAKCFKTAHQLLAFLKIDKNTLPYAIDDSQPFAMRLSQHLANRIDPKNPYDPILLQFLPVADENLEIEGFNTDPLEEEQFTIAPGLIHKYKNRALLIAHSACSIHCRYCFRRHFPYSEQKTNAGQFPEAFEYLSKNSQINELILSGGDPLSLSDEKLAMLISKIEAIAHIKTIRLHTRTAVAIPDRLTDCFVQLLAKTPLNVVLVLHINHAHEISNELITKIRTLKSKGVTIFNQSVLLKGINDNSDILIELSEQLFAAGILPYYLHLLDPIAGASHFLVSDDQAKHIWKLMQASLSGYLLPRLVRETPLEASKTWSN